MGIGLICQDIQYVAGADYFLFTFIIACATYLLSKLMDKWKRTKW